MLWNLCIPSDCAEIMSYCSPKTQFAERLDWVWHFFCRGMYILEEQGLNTVQGSSRCSLIPKGCLPLQWSALRCLSASLVKTQPSSLGSVWKRKVRVALWFLQIELCLCRPHQSVLPRVLKSQVERPVLHFPEWKPGYWLEQWKNASQSYLELAVVKEWSLSTQISL